jgi:hypothetical protein
MVVMVIGLGLGRAGKACHHHLLKEGGELMIRTKASMCSWLALEKRDAA